MANFGFVSAVFIFTLLPCIIVAKQQGTVRLWRNGLTSTSYTRPVVSRSTSTVGGATSVRTDRSCLTQQKNNTHIIKRTYESIKSLDREEAELYLSW